MWLMILACSGGDVSDTSTTAESAQRDGIPAIIATGEVTWTLAFDETAEQNGYVDCSYTRQYTGEQFLDMDYLCPTCDVLVRGTATMTEGSDCYSQISSDPQKERTELWGWGAGAFHRTSLDQYPLGELAEITDGGEDSAITLGWTSDSELSEGGVMTLTAAGTLSYTTDEDTLLDDPWAGPEVYACGWPQDDPGDLTLSYDLAVGSTFPNVRLTDQCGEELALWDLYGRWLVLDTSQYDCGPCRTMAAEAEDFVDAMAAEGTEVMVVSLLGNGLSEPFGTPDADTFTSWVDSYSLTDPVLYDQGFAYALFPDFVTAHTGESFGYPTWLVVDPQMNLLDGNIGFGSWDDVGDIIRAAQ